MPASDLHDPEDRDATGVKVRYLYCPECGHFSGGGVCRVCKRGLGEFVPPVPEAVSCNRQVPGDYELSEVIGAAETDWNRIAEDDGGIIINGPILSCHASRLEPGSDRVEVWRVDGETAADCQAFVDRLESMQS